MKEAEMYPEEYDPEDVQQMSNAKTFALVALVINGLYFAYNIYYFSTTDWNTIMEQVQQEMQKYQ